VSQPANLSPGTIVRTAFAAVTVVAVTLGVLLDQRWFAVSGLCGAVWILWDVIAEGVAAPLGRWTSAMLGGEGLLDPAPPLTEDDVVRLLESHLEGEASREVQIQSAKRLVELYRARRRHPSHALEVIATIRSRFPDARELDDLEP
jgi:hypothetical protein